MGNVWYFADLETYDGDGVVIKWGNSFTETNISDINEVQQNIKKQMSEELGVDISRIRFRQFNKL